MNQAILTSLLTLIGAILLFTMSELLRGLIIGPVLRIREQVGLIIDAVIYFSNDLTSSYPIEEEQAKIIQTRLRSAATQLNAKAEALPFYSLWTLIHLVPDRKHIDLVSKRLLELSSSCRLATPDALGRPRIYVPRDDNIKCINTIRHILNLKTDLTG